MIEIKRSHLIAATAAPLAIALIATALVLSRGRSPIASDPDAGTTTATGKKGKDRSRTGARKRTASDGTTTLAVSADGVDRIGTTLDGLGAGYRYEPIDDEELIDKAALTRFKAIFLTCAGGDAGEPQEGLPKALRDYVSDGGTLYASDLRYDTLAAAFPDLVDRPSVAQGVAQDLRGEITSPELREWLGHDITLHFKSGGWRPAAFRGDDVSVLLKGELKTTAGVAIDAPLAVRFPIGKGTVIFTSFHSEGRVSGDEAKLMKFLVLKAVTSASEARLTESLADAGFSAGAVRAEAADAGTKPVYHEYQHPKAGPLRFRLEPARPGATLRLEVVGPRGKTTTKRGDSALEIDLPKAGPGRWRFRAAAEKVPYPSFPAVVVVGKSGDSSDPSAARKNTRIVATDGNVHFEPVSLNKPAVAKQARRLRIAVTEPMFDDMGKLLNALGDGYQHTQIDDEDLIKPTGLDRYDVLFLTCGGWPHTWALTTSDKALRPGLIISEMRPEIRQKLVDNLIKFVGRGGTLYASDLRTEFLYYAFPERIPAPELDVRPLKEIDDTERRWLKLVLPAAQVETTAQTLDRLKLSEKLRARRDDLLAIVNLSVLVKLDKQADDPDDLASVRAKMERFELPGTEGDCQMIAEEFGRRRTAILEAISGRSKTKLSKLSGESNRILATLKEPAGRSHHRLRRRGEADRRCPCRGLGASGGDRPDDPTRVPRQELEPRPVRRRGAGS